VVEKEITLHPDGAAASVVMTVVEPKSPQVYLERVTHTMRSSEDFALLVKMIPQRWTQAAYCLQRLLQHQYQDQ
jgi:hypothetical protein